MRFGLVVKVPEKAVGSYRAEEVLHVLAARALLEGEVQRPSWDRLPVLEQAPEQPIALVEVERFAEALNRLPPPEESELTQMCSGRVALGRIVVLVILGLAVIATVSVPPLKLALSASAITASPPRSSNTAAPSSV